MRLIVARCEVHLLRHAERVPARVDALLMLKDDGSVLVHADAGA
jgi:RecB family endonuclease NucS